MSDEAAKELICILCPLGCKMQVSEKPGQPGELKVRNIQCKKGKDYACEEYKNPTRILTSTVAIHNAPLPRLPVRTSRALPKKLVFPAMREIDRVEVTGPVKVGTVIIEDILGSGVDVIASRSL